MRKCVVIYLSAYLCVFRTSIQNGGSLPNESVNNTENQVSLSNETSHDYSNVYILKQTLMSIARLQPNLSQTSHTITFLMSALPLKSDGDFLQYGHHIHKNVSTLTGPLNPTLTVHLQNPQTSVEEMAAVSDQTKKTDCHSITNFSKTTMCYCFFLFNSQKPPAAMLKLDIEACFNRNSNVKLP